MIELPKYGYPVPWVAPANIVGKGGEFFRPALGYEQSVKRISVDGSKINNSTSMLENHGKDIESGRFQFVLERIVKADGNRQFSDGCFDRYFPNADNAYKGFRFAIFDDLSRLFG